MFGSQPMSGMAGVGFSSKATMFSLSATLTCLGAEIRRLSCILTTTQCNVNAFRRGGSFLQAFYGVPPVHGRKF